MWNEKYDRDDFLYGTEPNDFLRVASLVLPEQANLLSLAEGEGRNACYLASQGHKVTAVDASEIGLEKASILAEIKKVELYTELADLADYDMGEEKWDAIIAIFCHLPPELRKTVAKRIIKALKPGGFYISEVYAKKQLTNETGGPKDINLLIDLEEIQKEMFGLNWIHSQQIEREIFEGSGHTGKGWVSQVIGQKPS
ncbi:class I SAM-dependent methyltransferase [Thiomicrospira microaerophila]|uniref:class I SAM-dependent methyltransferase n=1 Tax=Thiomicrospira microaerophila TaxID=406020 RepID=UPI0020101461|nr:class I SAM-dependent methyltransferase [Thiomicrospira microaerophila]UQB42841.1 class I SAM-dependent methyltransferase [Thiomicrospira microaerophila]